MSDTQGERAPARSVAAADDASDRSGGKRSSLPVVSVIMPARDAGATIGAALDSVLAQEYPGVVEIVVADGSDGPGMATLLRERYPTVRVVPNPQKVIGYGNNAAIQASSGEVLVRCDAHTMLAPGYVQRAVETLERTGAANVGGRKVPLGETLFERAVALALGTFSGSGGARYLQGGREGAVDTVFLGVYCREQLEAVGGYDPELVRNQDYELNWRLRQRGGVIWFDPQLEVYYRPRSSVGALARQYFDYGRWKRVMAGRHPASLRPRQLAAPLLVSGLAISMLLAFSGIPWPLAAAVPLAYLLALTVSSMLAGIRHRTVAALLAPLALATMHLSWGIGFFLPPRKQDGGGTLSKTGEVSA